MEITVRKYQPSDREEYRLMTSEFYDIYHRQFIIPPENPLRTFIDFKDLDAVIEESVDGFTDGEKYQLLVAEDKSSGKVVGYICGYIEELPSYELDKAGKVEEWFVREAYRGKGVGRLLYEALIDYFKEQRCTHVELETFATNTPALKIYEKMGFLQKYVTLVRKLE